MTVTLEENIEECGLRRGLIPAVIKLAQQAAAEAEFTQDDKGRWRVADIDQKPGEWLDEMLATHPSWNTGRSIEGKNFKSNAPAGVTNPYHDSYKASPEVRQQRIVHLIKTLGPNKAAALARAAGKTIAGTPLLK